jgi:glycosyltransferase involved in cell wall biosynthesis
MKILFITHYTELYGANKSLLSLVEGFKKTKNVECAILIPANGDLKDYCIKNNIKYFQRPFMSFVHSITQNKRYFFTFVNFLKKLKYIPRLIKLCLEYKPDIIYSNSSVIGVGAVLSIILHKKHIWHLREFQKEHYNIEFDLGNKLFGFLLNRSHKIIAISNVIEEHYRKITNNKIHIVYNGIINNNQIINNKHLINNNLINFTIVGLLHFQKNQMEAIKAFNLFNKEYPNSKLNIVGNGNNNYLRELKTESIKLKLTNKINFTGYISNIDLIYAKTDILILCSNKEGMGRVTVEAMSHGIPVIGKNSGATPEIIQHKYNGLLYNNDENELAMQMKFFVENPEEYNKFSKNAIDTVKKKFTIEKYVENIYKIIKYL